jgi:hypothetical protein
MLSIQTTDPKEARRARLAQFQGHKAMLTLMGSTVRGLVRSVKEDTTSTPPRWIVSDVSMNAVVAQIDFAYREQFELKPPIKKGSAPLPVCSASRREGDGDAHGGNRHRASLLGHGR